jgi:hypothetical protein
MLKKALNCVLGSKKSSMYPRGYACGFFSPAALLNRLFEHPAWLLPLFGYPIEHTAAGTEQKLTQACYAGSVWSGDSSFNACDRPVVK